MDEEGNVVSLQKRLIDENNECPEKKTSFFHTSFNTLNTLSGVGILSTPYALASGGWMSLALLFVLATAAFYSGVLIKKCMDADSNIATYPDIGELAFGSKGRLIISIFMYLELYLVATGFLILEGDNLHNLFPEVGTQILGLKIGGEQIFVVVVAIVILPTVWVDNLRILSYISACGVVASVIILGSITCVGASDDVGFTHKGRLINWGGIPTAVSLYGFCFCAHPVFPTLYTSMKKRHQFNNVLLVSFLLCTFIYASMAIEGYLMFGSQVESQITLKLPVERLSSKVAIYTTLVNPMAKYALMLSPIMDALNTKFYGHRHAKMILRILSGTALVTSMTIVALAVPFFGDLMSLVGAFLSISASIIFPCLCYLKISRKYRKFGWETVVLVGIVLMGVAVVIAGSYTSLVEIADHYRTKTMI